MQKAFVDTSIIMRLLVRDSAEKYKDVERLLTGSRTRGISLHLLPIAILETVFVLEKVYRLDKGSVAERVEALLNTPDLIVEQKDVFLRAIGAYVERNVKFADAVMGYWGLAMGISDVFTYDEKDFHRIEGLKVLRP